MRNLLSAFLIWGVYPAWLLAGAADYFCHRRTDIVHTTGAVESWLHVAQFVCLALAVACAALLQINATVFAAMVILVLAHSVLSHIDVRYTDGRRYIAPVEQTVHGFMEVLPLVAIALFGILHWEEISGGPMQPVAATPERVLLLSSFVVMAGLPVLEELLRSRRSWQANGQTNGLTSG
jgi:hypothetical protein